MFNADPNRSTDEILDDIRTSSHLAFNSKNLAYVFPPLGALLVKLSRDSASAQKQLVADLNRLGDEAKETALQAAKTADKILLFTQWLFWATVILLIVTILLVALEFMKFNEPRYGDSKSDQTQQKNPREISKLPAPTTQQQKGMDFIEKYKTGLSPPSWPLRY